MERLHGASTVISLIVLALGCGAESSNGDGPMGGGAAADPLGGSSGAATGGSAAAAGGGVTGAAAGGQSNPGGGTGSAAGGQSDSGGGPSGGVGATPTGGASSSGTTSAGAGGASTGAGGDSATSTGGSQNGGGAGGTMGGGGSSAQSGGSSGSTGGGGPATGGSGGGAHVSVPFILGADISFVQEQEDQGTRFRDGGAEQDVIQILKNHGFNYVRLRLFHDPGAPNGYQHEFTERAEPYCDTSHTIELAQRVKSAGMGFSLDFHYSDTWADPDDQNKPAAWVYLGFAELVTAVHDYTRDTLLTFQAAGALPDMVQVGNEITPGMLLPDGSSNDWDNLSELLKAGVAAVNEVDSSILKVMHIESPHHPDTVSWWTRSALESGVEFDILGVSCYSAWHGEPSVWQSTFERVASENPGLSFMIAEYADNYREANDILFNLPQGVGTMFWEPTADGEWGTGLIDGQGNTRDTLELYDQMATDYGLR